MRPGSRRNSNFNTQYIWNLYQSTHNTNMRHNMRPGSHRNSKFNTHYIWNLYQSTHNTNMRHNMRPGLHKNSKFNTQYISDHHIINKSTFRQQKILYITHRHRHCHCQEYPEVMRLTLEEHRRLPPAKMRLICCPGQTH